MQETSAQRDVQGCIPFLFECILGGWTPTGIAFGTALGMMIGLLPKDNLLSLLLFLWLFLAGGNMLFGIVSAFFCSIASRWTASIADSLGTAALDSEWGEAVFSRLYEYPLVPWTDLNNTVVLGQFLIALGLFLPVFLFVWGMCPRGKAPEERDQT